MSVTVIIIMTIMMMMRRMRAVNLDPKHPGKRFTSSLPVYVLQMYACNVKEISHFQFYIFTFVQKLKFSRSGRGSNSRSIDWEMAGQNEGDAKIDFPVNRRREELG